MASRGRCAGCGHEDLSIRKVQLHTSTCAEYLTLWREHPEQALEPEAEFVRVHDPAYKAAVKEFKSERHGRIKRHLLGLANARQRRDAMRWQQVTNHGSKMVAPPGDGVLSFTGPGAQLAEQLCTQPHD